MGSKIFVNAQNKNKEWEDQEIETLTPESLERFISTKMRYGNSDDAWNLVRQLVSFIQSGISERLLVYQLTVKELLEINEGQTVEMKDGAKIIADWAEDLEHIKNII